MHTTTGRVQGSQSAEPADLGLEGWDERRAWVRAWVVGRDAGTGGKGFRQTERGAGEAR